MEIDLINVSKNYRYQKVLRNINYSFRKNNVYFIIGESGCGKSTLIKIIGNIIEDYDGKVLFDGKDVKKIDPEYLKRHIIAYIDQNSTLIKYLSINDNIKFLINKEANINSKKQFNKYSGGEKRRIATYVSTLKDSEVILADEISSSLDKENALNIMNYLREVAKDKILIVVTHDQFLIKDTDNIINLENNVSRRRISTKKFKYKCYKKDKNFKKLLIYPFYKIMSKIKYVFSFLTSFMVGLILILLVSSLKTGIVSFLDNELLKDFNFKYLLVQSDSNFNYGFLDEFKSIAYEGILLLDDVSFDPMKNMIYIETNKNMIYFDLDDELSMSKELYELNNYNFNLNINGYEAFIDKVIDERELIIHCPCDFFDKYYLSKGYSINKYSSKLCVLKVDEDFIINSFEEISSSYSKYNFKNTGIDSYVYIDNMLHKIELLLLIFIITSLLVTFFLVMTIIKLDINEDEEEIKFMKNSGLSDKFIFNFYLIANLYRGILTFIITSITYYIVISFSNYILKEQLEIEYNILTMSFKSLEIIMALIIVIITLSMFLSKKRLKVIKN